MSGTISYDTRAALAAASIPTSSGINFVLTAGYSAVSEGGGGALWKRSTGTPTHPWSVQDATSPTKGWWEIADDIVKPQQRGVFLLASSATRPYAPAGGGVGTDITGTLTDFESGPYGTLYLSDGIWYSTNEWAADDRRSDLRETRHAHHVHLRHAGGRPHL